MPLALGIRGPAAQRVGRGRPDHGGPGLSSGLRGHRTAVARRLPERAPAAAGHDAASGQASPQAGRHAAGGLQPAPHGAGAARPHPGHAADSFDAGHGIPLRRAPDARLACEQAYGPADAPYVASLRELLGLIGAYEWRRKGVEIPALGGDRIHPHYGVLAGAREYVDSGHRRRCRPATRPSTSASAPACCRPCWRDAAWLV